VDVPLLDSRTRIIGLVPLELAEIGTEMKEIVLYNSQDCFYILGTATRQGPPYRRVQLVDGSVGLDPPGRLGQSTAAGKRRRPIISGPRVDLGGRRIIKKSEAFRERVYPVRP
jgi:hypothetical protein